MKKLIEILSNPKLDKFYFVSIWILLVAKFVIHIIAAQNYGFHRDELLHLAVGKQFALGYMEFPPMIAWLSAFIQSTLGKSLLAIRFFPAVAGVLLLYLIYLMVKELTQNQFGQFLAVLSAFVSTAYFRNHTLFSPVVFEQVLWALSFLFLLKYIHHKEDKFLIYLGLSVGFGILTKYKYTMLFWVVGLIIASLFTNYRTIYSKKVVWKTMALTFVIVLPNFFWQMFHNFPILRAMQAMKNRGNPEASDFPIGDFFMEQAISMNEFSFLLALASVGLLLFSHKLQKYRIFGIMFLVIMLLMMLSHLPSDALFAIYPIYFAFVGKIFAELLQGNFIIFRGILLSLSLAWGLFLMPTATPILGVEQFISYANINKNPHTHRVILPDTYANMFGWEEQVSELAKIYHQSFSVEEKKHCVIWTKNYGEASAMAYYAHQYKIPKAICKQGSFWLWGSGNNDAKIALTIGFEKAFLKNFYNEVQEIKRLKIPYVNKEEYNIPIFICFQPKVKLPEFWKEFEKGIFD